MKLELTKEEKELFNGNKEAIKDFLSAKAVLEETKNYEFENQEKMELKYFTETEKLKYFMTKRIEDKINVSQEEVAKVYTEHKKEFDSQKVQFSEAKKIIENDMIAQQLTKLEHDEITSIINNMENDVTFSKEEMLFSSGNSEILRGMLTNKIIMSEFEKGTFKEDNKKELENIENNVLANYYLDVNVRKVVKVTHGEVDDFYNKEKAKFENVPQDEAYNEIANYLLSEKVVLERARIIKEIAEKYDVDKLVEENL